MFPPRTLRRLRELSVGEDDEHPTRECRSDVCLVLQDLDNPPKLSHSRFIHVHTWYVPNSCHVDDDLLLPKALVAIRVFALHNGRSWVRKFLWMSGSLYFLSTMIIVTLGTIPVFGTSAILSVSNFAHQSQRDSPALSWRMRGHCGFISMSETPFLIHVIDAMVALDYLATWVGVDFCKLVHIILMALYSIFFETILFVLTLVALLNQQGRRSFSQLTAIIYRDGQSHYSWVTINSHSRLVGMVYFTAVTSTSPLVCYEVIGSYTTLLSLLFVLPSVSLSLFWLYSP